MCELNEGVQLIFPTKVYNILSSLTSLLNKI